MNIKYYMDWCDKYKPIKAKDIIGQTVAVKRITQFLNNEKRKKNCVILTGKNGIGKTLLANVILKELGFHIKNIDDNHNLKKLINVSVFFNKNKKVGIIYESAYVKRISDDLKSIKQSKQPIIFICDSNEIEKYKSLKKLSEVIYMRSPTISEQTKYLSKILKKEKLSIPKKDIEFACEQSQGDTRSLIINSQFWGEKLKTEEKGKKDIHHSNIFKIVPEFFDCCNSTQEKIDYFIDMVYLPDLLFLNYINTKVEKIDPIHDKLKKKLKESMLKAKIKKAKEEYKKTGIKIKKVKKPKVNEEDVNILYKLHAFSDTISEMSNADLIRQRIAEKQKFELVPYFKYLMSGACTNCSGMLLEKDIRYTKPKFSKTNNDNGIQLSPTSKTLMSEISKELNACF